MGTRSLTKVIETYKDKDNKKHKTNLICMYRQYDGYPSGHGQELSDFLFDRKIVNGFTMEHQRGKYNNGMGCLGAELVSEFKDGIGNIYIQDPNTEMDYEDFEYIIEGSNEDGLNIRVNNFDGVEVFNGSVGEFRDFCNE